MPTEAVPKRPFTRARIQNYSSLQLPKIGHYTAILTPLVLHTPGFVTSSSRSRSAGAGGHGRAAGLAGRPARGQRPCPAAIPALFQLRERGSASPGPAGPGSGGRGGERAHGGRKGRANTARCSPPPLPAALPAPPQPTGRAERGVRAPQSGTGRFPRRDSRPVPRPPLPPPAGLGCAAPAGPGSAVALTHKDAHLLLAEEAREKRGDGEAHGGSGGAGRRRGSAEGRRAGGSAARPVYAHGSLRARGEPGSGGGCSVTGDLARSLPRHARRGRPGSNADTITSRSPHPPAAAPPSATRPRRGGDYGSRRAPRSSAPRAHLPSPRGTTGDVGGRARRPRAASGSRGARRFGGPALAGGQVAAPVTLRSQSPGGDGNRVRSQHAGRDW